MLGCCGAVKQNRLLAFARTILALLLFVGALLLLHCLEIAVWGQAGFWLQILPGRYTAYYFSIMNYATVVWGDVGAPRH